MRAEGLGPGAVDITEEEEDLLEDPDFFHIQDDENMNEDFLYVVKKSLIIDEWKKRRVQIERRQRIELMNKKSQGRDLRSLLANSFKKKMGKQAISFMDAKDNQPAWKINKAAKESKSESNKPKTKDLQSHLKVVFLEALRKDNVKADENEHIEVDMTDFEI